MVEINKQNIKQIFAAFIFIHFAKGQPSTINQALGKLSKLLSNNNKPSPYIAFDFAMTYCGGYYQSNAHE